MINKLKCPFCQKELKLIGEKSDSGYPIDEYFCGCPQTAFHFGNTPMWNELRVLHEKLEERKESCKVTEKELIRTRKALEAAINAMKSAGTHNSINCIARGEDPSKDDVGITINHALNKITALTKGGDNE